MGAGGGQKKSGLTGSPLQALTQSQIYAQRLEDPRQAEAKIPLLQMLEPRRVRKHVKTDKAFCQLIPTPICTFVWTGPTNYRVKQTKVAHG